MKSRLSREEAREAVRAAALLESLQGEWPGICVAGIEVGPATIACLLLDWADGGDRWADDQADLGLSESPPASVFADPEEGGGDDPDFHEED